VTLRAVLERTRDTDDLVRKAAYKFIAEKVKQFFKKKEEKNSGDKCALIK
jgi:hypothetical protein